jgi:trimeric autotransporter adhesin
MKTITKFTCPASAALALVCLAALSTAQAVTPPPDGGYPGGNTAEGDNALLNLTSGINNTAVGFNALRDNTTGGWNVAIGASALSSNTTGQQNMAIGTEALRDNNANFNLAIGFRVGFMNTTGKHLTGIGAAALRNNTTGNYNTAIGADALGENTTGEANTATGSKALLRNTIGSFNTATGNSALVRNTTGGHNTANGSGALFINTTGSTNTAMGSGALHFNSTGTANTATGGTALLFNTTGHSNTATGVQALYSNTSGNRNTATGVSALLVNRGSQNTAVGEGALFRSSSGNDNTALGDGAGSLVTTASNVTCIGTNVLGANLSNTTWIGNIYGITTQNGTTAPVIVSADGQLGTVASSARFKKDIATMETASEAILSLRPVTFHYKTDTTGIPQFGLIAEEVAKVNPALVLADKEGKPYTVRYEAVNAMLLNEFLKEHRTVQEQKATIAQLKEDFQSKLTEQQKQIQALTVGLQKVSAQLELNKPAPQTVLSNR